jgi:V/A-type H+-transporting ATPase subunit D
LLARKAQIGLAKQGRDLLEQKRTALMKELLRVADSVMELSDALQQVAAAARKGLARAEATAGTQAVQSAALAARAELPLELSSVNVMGVRIPQIEQKRVRRSMLGRGYSVVGTSITIDEAAAAFEAEVETMLQVADSELRLRRLANEIQHTSRRLNALDHMLIPRLEAERDYIQATLDEHERSDHFRLKLVKRHLERKRGEQAVDSGRSFREVEN